MGAYDPQKPSKNISFPCTSAFKSGVTRASNQRFLEEQAELPDPTSYQHLSNFDTAELSKDTGTANFMQAHQKKVVAINMYDPHEDPKKKQTVAPGPGAYNVVKELPKILEE